LQHDLVLADVEEATAPQAPSGSRLQVLYRTRSMDAAAGWMADYSVPPPARDIHNTGEQAMLGRPDDACGAYTGFVEPV
jgi:hypothetical protein